jgi:SCF-associated factor 1
LGADVLGKSLRMGKSTFHLIRDSDCKVEGDEFWGTTKSTPYLVPFPQPIQRISVGRRNCLALADNGNLLTVDLDFQYPAIIKLTSPDIVSPDLPNGEHPVLHMSAGWRFAAAVIKGIGLMVWNSEVAGEDRRLIRRSNALLQRNRLLNRNFKARQVMRTEEVGVEPEQAGDLEIIGLMVGDGFLIYLTHGGTVHRVNIVYESIDSPDQPISFLLEEFAATPKLSYLSGSFFHFGLFNATGTVLVGSIDSMHTSNPQKPTGLQNRGVVALSWGDWHGLALCEDGSILTWGRELSGNGCLGLGYRDLDDAREMGLTISGTVINCLEPMRIAGYGGEEADYFAFGVAAGGWHSAALVANFKVQEQRKRDW